MRWSRSFSTAKMPGNIILNRAANFCGGFTMRCSATRSGSGDGLRRPSLVTSSSPSEVAGARVVDSCEFQRLDRRSRRQSGLGLSLHMREISTRRPRPRPREAQRKLAFEEILIAEGSDWNWWYGPEHHSANDREFDELYRKHLSNVYQALGAARRTTWRSPSSAARYGRRSFRKPPTFIPGSPATWCAISSGWGSVVHRRPARRRNARQTVSAGRGPGRDRREPTFTGDWTLPRI